MKRMCGLYFIHLDQALGKISINKFINIMVSITQINITKEQTEKGCFIQNNFFVYFLCIFSNFVLNSHCYNFFIFLLCYTQITC